MDSTYAAYPDPNIDPRQKGYDWILQYCTSAWQDANGFSPLNMLYFGRSRYAEIRQYRMGKQSINKYKRIQPGDDIEDKTENNLNSQVVPILSKFVEIAIAKILQQEYDTQVFAVDPIAKSEEDAYFTKMKAKIQMRQLAMQAGSPLADSPVLKPNPKEPEDLEQLQMEMDFGYKHVMSMEAEQAIMLVRQQNDFRELRRRVVEYLVDFGIGGYRTFIDYNGNVKFREVNPENLITSYCEKSDFSDMVHCGEIVPTKVSDLIDYFTPDQIEDICKNVAGKFNNPKTLNVNQSRYWDRFKVLVFDLEFLSWNTTVYSNEIDGRGNERFGRTDYKNIRYVSQSGATVGLPTNESERGQADPVYMSTTKQVKYKAKWIVGTTYMYDYGLAENQNRKKSNWTHTSLDFHLFAWNGYKMMYEGLTERLIPLADAYQLTWRKLQNLKNKLIPYLIELDLNALESVGLGAKGQQNMKPSEIIDFAFNNFILMKRSSDLLSSNPNYKAVDIQATGQLEAFAQLYADLDRIYLMMQQVSGLNEFTDGSTPNAKALVPTVETANVSTNNALFLIMNADKQLAKMLDDSIIQKVQMAVKLGKVQGFVKALGMETVKFLQINPDISLYEFGIFVEEAPTRAQWEALYQELNIKESQGLIDASQKIIVMSCRTLKQAQMYLSYSIKKNRERMEQAELAKIQANNQGQQQIMLAAEQMKQQTLMMTAKLEIEKEMVKGQWQYTIEMMKKQSDLQEANVQGESKIVAADLQKQAKIISSQIAASAKEAASKAV